MLMSFVLSKIRTWVTFHDTVRALQCLNEKALLDVGISRSDIKDVARQSLK
jgi:uncharacterized protein YjiS (DUF1127 family)